MLYSSFFQKGSGGWFQKSYINSFGNSFKGFPQNDSLQLLRKSLEEFPSIWNCSLQLLRKFSQELIKEYSQDFVRSSLQKFIRDFFLVKLSGFQYFLRKHPPEIPLGVLLSIPLMSLTFFRSSIRDADLGILLDF